MIKFFKQVSSVIKPGEVLSSVVRCDSSPILTDDNVVASTEYGNELTVPDNLQKIIVRDETGIVNEKCFLKCDNNVFLVRIKIVKGSKAYVLVNKVGVNEFLKFCKSREVDLLRNSIFEAVSSLLDYETRDYLSIINDDVLDNHIDNIGSSVIPFILYQPEYSYATKELIDDVEHIFGECNTFYQDMIDEVIYNDYPLGYLYEDGVSCCDAMLNNASNARDFAEVINTWQKPILPLDYQYDALLKRGIEGNMSTHDVARYVGRPGNIKRRYFKTINKFSFGMMMWLSDLSEVPAAQFSFRYILSTQDTELLSCEFYNREAYDFYNKNSNQNLLVSVMENSTRVLPGFVNCNNVTDVIVTKTDTDELVVETKGYNSDCVVIDLVLISVIDNAFIRTI